tara:strand:- start:10757 stop:10984 length:228 start_codon:yes stop_codon:yes gene_type:complete
MCKFYLNKSKKYLKAIKKNKDGIFVSTNHQFVGTVVLKSGIKLNIKLHPAYNPSGSQGTITKNPNKFVVDIKEIK